MASASVARPSAVCACSPVAAPRAASVCRPDRRKRMTMPVHGLVMLQRRSEFLRIRGGLRWSCQPFVLEAKSRDGWVSPVSVPADIARFGLTVTKQHGSAVVRNRTRRRLKAALRDLAPRCAKPGFDYVIVARAGIKDLAFERMLAELTVAFERVHSSPKPRSKPPPRPKPSENSSRS